MGKKITKKKLIPTREDQDPQVGAQGEAGDISRAFRKLDNYLAKEVFERRKRLKAKFDAEIEQMRGANLQLIVFRIGSEQYAFEILRTREVIPTPSFSELPHTASHISGVAKVRESMVLMLDLEEKFGIEGNEKTVPPFTLIVEHADYKVGLMIREVPRTLKVSGSTVNTAGKMVSDTTRDETYIKGVIDHDGDLIFLMDIEEFVDGNKVQMLPENLQSTT